MVDVAQGRGNRVLVGRGILGKRAVSRAHCGGTDGSANPTKEPAPGDALTLGVVNGIVVCNHVSPPHYIVPTAVLRHSTGPLSRWFPAPAPQETC